MLLFIWLLVIVFFRIGIVENNLNTQIKYSNINVDINKPIGYSIHRFRCYFSSCNYEFDSNDLSSTIWQIVDDEVIVVQNLHHIYKHYGRNHLIPVLHIVKKNSVKNVVEVLNVTLSKPMDSCLPFFLPKIIDSGWIVERSSAGNVVQGLDHLIFKSAKECTPQIMFADKTMFNNYRFTINATADPKLHRIQIYARNYVHIKKCKQKYTCPDHVSLILSHKPTGIYQMINVTINVLASGHFMPHISPHFVNHLKVPLGAPAGTMVGQVNVTDYDPGFDGEIVFTLISISQYFYIDIYNGKVFSLQPIVTPIEGQLDVSVRDRSCYIHSQPLQIKLFYSTVPKISIYKPASFDVYKRTAQYPLYKTVNLYSDLPDDAYVVSGAEFAKSIQFNRTLNYKISFSDQQSKHILYAKDYAVYYKGINEKNSQYFSLSVIHHIVIHLTADDSLVYTAHIYVKFHPGRTCLGALPKLRFNKPFQIADVGNFDARIAFDPTTMFHYNGPSYLADYGRKMLANDPCFVKQYINVSVIDSYGSDNFYMGENSNYISSKYPLYDPDNDYYILLQGVNEICDSEIAYKGFAIVKLNVQLKHNKYNPFFHNSTYIFNISESLRPPSYVGAVKIRFADSIGYLLNPNYLYYIKNYDNTTADYIAVDRNSGMITLLKDVDREIMPQLKFGISAVNPQNNLSTETVIIINVDDEDDNPPVFPRKRVEINLEHNSGYIDQVLCVHADDKDDTRKFPLTYFIHSGPKHLFQLSPSTGVLSLVGSLKGYELNDTIRLNIRAMDTKHHDDMILNIFVEDPIEDRPLFQKFVHNFTLIKDALAGTLVTSLEVAVKSERLFHVSCRFGRDISYTIASLFSVRFNLDSKACFLHLLRSLTYKDVKNILTKDNSFLLELYDNKKSIMFPAQALLNVKLVLTDNKVVFDQNDYIFQHFEIIPINGVIGQVNALNYYQNNDQIFYKLESFSECHPSANCSSDRLHSLFNVDKRTGLISSMKLLTVGFEDDIVISATNKAGLQSVVVCKVLVLPLSYKPMFNSIKPVEISLSESSPIGTGYTIASFKTSKYGRNYINAHIDIVGGNWLNHFKIFNNETIKLNQKIDYECIQWYNIRYRWKQIVDNNTFDSVYLENVIHIKVIDENDNAPIFPDEDPAFLIIQGLSYSRQYFAHFQAYGGDIEHRFHKVNYKFTNSKVSIFIHPTLGIVSVTNDFSLFDQVMVLTIRAENDDNPTLYALKNFSIIIVRNQFEDTTLDIPISEQYKSKLGNMNIEFNLGASPIQYIPRRIHNNKKPQYTIGRLFQNPLYGKRNFMCADPYGFINVNPIDADKNTLNYDNQHFTAADSVYVYKVKNSMYRIQNIVVELKATKKPNLDCNNFNDDFYFLSNNNITQIKPKLSCGNPNQPNLKYSLVSSSRSDFNDNVLTLGLHSGVVYIHKLPDLLFPITEYFTYRILDPSTNKYVFGRISIQIVNINYDIKISDLIIMNVYVGSPVVVDQLIYNPRLSDGRTSVGYRFYCTLESFEDWDIPTWLNINSTNGHITAIANYTLMNTQKLTLRATLLSTNGDNITSATQIIQLNPKSILMTPMINNDDGNKLSNDYTVLIHDESHFVSSPYGLFVGQVPILAKGIYSYHCQVVSTNIMNLNNQIICDNIVLLNDTLYLSPTIYNSIKHFKRFLIVKISVCREKCVPLILNILIIKPTLSAPYFIDCKKNHSIFLKNYQPISIPLNDAFKVPEVFEDIFVCNMNAQNPYFTAFPQNKTQCVVAPTRYFTSDIETNFIEKLSVDFESCYLKYYADRILQRNSCSRVDLIVHNYFPYYDSSIDNYGVVTVDEGVYDSQPITCIKKQSIGSVFSIAFPTQQHVTIDINEGCVYLLKAFNHSSIQKLSLIIKEVLFKLSDSPKSEICQKRCVIHHQLIVIVNNKNKVPDIIINVDKQHLNVPSNAPFNYKILDLNNNPRDTYFFISYDNLSTTNPAHQLPPIDIDPVTKSLVTVGNISDYITNTSNVQTTITLNMVHDSVFELYSSSKKLYLNFDYLPMSIKKPAFTIILPINHLPGMIGKIEIETLNPKDLSYSLKPKESSKLFNHVFSIDSSGCIRLLRQLDSMLHGHSHHSIIDMELLVVDNSVKSKSNVDIPISIILTQLWHDYSFLYVERNLTITYDELAQFGAGNKLRKVIVESAKITASDMPSNSWDSVLFTCELVPLMTNDEYHHLFQLSPNGTLYKKLDNELLSKQKLKNQIYALDLRNSKGAIVDSIILQVVELGDDSYINCVRFNSSPILAVIHPTFKINQLVRTINLENRCPRQFFQLKGFFNEFSDCFVFGVGRYSNNLYLSCQIESLIELLQNRRTVAFFIAIVEKNSHKKVYNRLIVDFGRLNYTNEITDEFLQRETPYLVNSKRNVIEIDDTISKGHIITYVEPLHVREIPQLTYMLECAENSCPFAINSVTGAISTRNDFVSFKYRQYILSVVLADEYQHYDWKRYEFLVDIQNKTPTNCNKNILNSMSIQISSKLNKAGTPIISLPATNDNCYLISDLTSESNKFFFVNPLTRVVYISKKLPYMEIDFNFAYYLTPSLYHNKRDPSSRCLLTIKLLKDDYNEIRFIRDQREIIIPKTHPIARFAVIQNNVFSLREHNSTLNNLIVTTLSLDNSKIKIFDNHKLAVRVIGTDQSNYFSAHLHPRLTSVAVFLHRKLPVQHYISRWNLSLEIYRTDDMNIVDTTTPNMIIINVNNVATTSPLVNSSIGQIIVGNTFPQTAEQIQLFSPDLLDPKNIVIQLDPKLSSFVRIVRSTTLPNLADVVIQSLWNTSSAQKLLSIKIKVGYKQPNNATTEKLLYSQQFILYVRVLHKHTSKRITFSQFVPQYLNTIASVSSTFSTNVFVHIPTLTSGNTKEIPIFFYKETQSYLPPDYSYSNFTSTGENFNNRSQAYFVDKVKQSLFTVSTITPPGFYKISAVRTHQKSKIQSKVVFLVKVSKINESLYSNENHIVLVLRSNELGLLYTNSNLFFNLLDLISIIKSNCFGSNYGIKVDILSLDHHLYYGQQQVHVYINIIDEISNISIKRSIVRESLEQCQTHIEHKLSATIISFNDDNCIAHSCQLGTCITRTDINFYNVVVTYVSSERNNSSNYYIYPKLNRQTECYSSGRINRSLLQKTDCFNNGVKIPYQIQSTNNDNMLNNFMCACPAGFNGKHCQSTEMSFSDKSQQPLTFNPIIFDVNTEISFSFATFLSNGILLLQNSTSKDILQHFHFAVKLQNGSLVVELLFYNVKESTLQHSYQNIMNANMTSIVIGTELNDGKIHHVNIIKRHNNITIKLDNCENNIHNEKPRQRTNYNYSFCRISTLLMSENNVHNGSLRLLVGVKFTGCIINLAIDEVVIDFNTFLRPQPPHVTLNMCLLGLKNCPRCKYGFCDRSRKPPYICRCFDGWTGTKCNIRMNSYHVESDGYVLVDQSSLYNAHKSQEVEKSEYSFYVDFTSVFLSLMVNEPSQDYIFVYESNDAFTEYSFVRLRNGFIEFVNNLGDEEYLIQFPFDFKNYYLSEIGYNSKKNKGSINDVHLKIGYLRDYTTMSPFKNGFLKVIAKRYRNIISIQIPTLGEVSTHQGVNNLLLTNHKIYIGNAPNNSIHRNENKFSNFSMCYASLTFNGIDVSYNSEGISKYNASVDCPCKENRLICVGKSMCVGSHEEYCGCHGNPGTYCGHLQLTFTGRNLVYILVLMAMFVSLWAWLCLLIYKQFRFRYYKFKHKIFSTQTSQEIMLGVNNKPNQCNKGSNFSSSYPSSVQQFNDLNVKNIFQELKGHHNDEMMHFDTTDAHDDYKPSFKIFVKQSDDEETTDQFKTLPPLTQDAVDKKNISSSTNRQNKNPKF